MSVVDLRTRHTTDWNLFCENISSSESYLFVNNLQDSDFYETSLDLSVGNKCMYKEHDKVFKIPSEGMKLRSGQSAIVYTKNQIAVPLNMYGVVTGTGMRIFSRCFISTGKIDPGFKGYLKIGIYNGSNQSIVLKEGEPLVCIFFMSIENDLQNTLFMYDQTVEPQVEIFSFWDRLLRKFFTKDGYQLLANILGVIGGILAIILTFIKWSSLETV